MSFAACLSIAFLLNMAVLDTPASNLDTATVNLEEWSSYVASGYFEGSDAQYEEYLMDYDAYSYAFDQYAQASSTWDGIYYPTAGIVSVGIFLFVGVWYLRKKGRSLWNLFWFLLGFIGVLILLLLENRREEKSEAPLALGQANGE